MKIKICQLNPLVGDVFGNADTVIRILSETPPHEADLLIFPELFLQGYPPRDLLEAKWFIEDSLRAVEKIKEASRLFPDTGIIAGSAMPSYITDGKDLFNSALLICNGEILLQQNKSLLPDYDIFDESRYFHPAQSVSAVKFKNETLGICICEDAWNSIELLSGRLYGRDPVTELAAAGATLLINISASPFFLGKQKLRSDVMRNHAVKHNLPFIFVNQVGANDELIFDGASKCFGSKGNLCCQLPSFSEETAVVNTSVPSVPLVLPVTEEQNEIKLLQEALTLGLHDYVKKCGVSKVVIGLSGGIDCAVVCALAVKALGKENVWGVAMPSRYSSKESITDAKTLADNLEIKFDVINIEETFCAFLNTLQPLFEKTQPNMAEENLQARIRGTLLMTLSNKFGHMVLVTSNKSESAVGYSTLYGDMCGGLAVISDLTKEMVYKLAAYINTDREIIPQSTIDKPPSAELRPGQRDDDSLPPYPLLDPVLTMLINNGKSTAETISAGYDKNTVKWIANAVKSSEYKRRQAAPGLKVTEKSFGSGRRFPVAAKYNW